MSEHKSNIYMKQKIITRVLLFLIIAGSLFPMSYASGEITRTNYVIPAPKLESPVDGSTSLNTNLSLSWSGVSGALTYEVAISTDSSFQKDTIIKTGLQDVSCIIENLQTGMIYYWRVRTNTDAGNSDWSEVWNFTTYSKFPDAPQIIYPRDKLANVPPDLTIMWEPVTGGDKYEIQIALDSNYIETVNDIITTQTSFTIDTLKQLTSYYLRIRAVKESDVGKWSIISFTTVKKLSLQTELLTPKDGEKVSFSNIMLSWSQVTDAQYYDVEVSKYEDFRTTIVKSSRTISNYVQIIELTPSTLYYWRVRVVANNIDGLWSKISKFKTYVKLEAPVLESPYNNTERVSESTVFSWNTLFYNPDYEIQFSLFSDFKNVDTSFTIGSANTSISNLKLKYETKYYWKVRGVVGDESGPWSAVYSFITLGKLPDKIVCMKPASEYNHYANYKMPNQIFIWLKDPYSDSYMIQFSADSNFQILVYQQSKIKDTSVFIYDIKSDYRFWRVRGENQWGAGEWSERKIFNFTLPVEKISEVPDKFKLMQNYPNPFNPSTKIRYYLPERAQVFLSIFDVLGRIVEEYDKGIQDVGCHEIIWEPKSSVGEISGGTYFYKLQAGKFTDVRKLVYLK